MASLFTKVKLLTAVTALLLVSGCEKKNASTVKGITLGDGSESLGLVPVRNDFSQSSLTTVTPADAGTQFHKDLASNALAFAFVACQPYTINGTTVDPDTTLLALEAQAALDNVYITADRKIAIAVGTDQGNTTDGKRSLVTQPCLPVGDRLISFPVLRDILMAPLSTQTGGATPTPADSSLFSVEQFFYLSLRGYLVQGNTSRMSPFITAIHEMQAQDSPGDNTDFDTVLLNLDQMFNPCDSTNPASGQRLGVFTCNVLGAKGGKSVASYTPDGDKIDSLRQSLAALIVQEHNLYNPATGAAMTPTEALWDALSTTANLCTRGDSLGSYLCGASTSFNFSGTYKSASYGPQAAAPAASLALLGTTSTLHGGGAGKGGKTGTTGTKPGGTKTGGTGSVPGGTGTVPAGTTTHPTVPTIGGQGSYNQGSVTRNAATGQGGYPTNPYNGRNTMGMPTGGAKSVPVAQALQQYPQFSGAAQRIVANAGNMQNFATPQGMLDAQAVAGAIQNPSAQNPWQAVGVAGAGNSQSLVLSNSQTGGMAFVPAGLGSVSGNPNVPLQTWNTLPNQQNNLMPGLLVRTDMPYSTAGGTVSGLVRGQTGSGAQDMLGISLHGITGAQINPQTGQISPTAAGNGTAVPLFTGTTRNADGSISYANTPQSQQMMQNYVNQDVISLGTKVQTQLSLLTNATTTKDANAQASATAALTVLAQQSLDDKKTVQETGVSVNTSGFDTINQSLASFLPGSVPTATKSGTGPSPLGTSGASGSTDTTKATPAPSASGASGSPDTSKATPTPAAADSSGATDTTKATPTPAAGSSTDTTKATPTPAASGSSGEASTSSSPATGTDRSATVNPNPAVTPTSAANATSTSVPTSTATSSSNATTSSSANSASAAGASGNASSSASATSSTSDGSTASTPSTGNASAGSSGDASAAASPPPTPGTASSDTASTPSSASGNSDTSAATSAADTTLATNGKTAITDTPPTPSSDDTGGGNAAPPDDSSSSGPTGSSSAPVDDGSSDYDNSDSDSAGGSGQ